MPKILVYLFAIIISVFLFVFNKMTYGLFYWRMSHLTQEDLRWLDGNSWSDACFISDNGKKSFLKVKDIQIHDKRNPFFMSANYSSDYEAWGQIDFEIKESLQTIPGSFTIVRKLDDDRLHYCSQLGAQVESRKSRPIQSDSIIKDNMTISTSILIKNGEYSFLETPTDSAPKITEYAISPKYGLVYYKHENGNKYYRQF